MSRLQLRLSVIGFFFLIALHAQAGTAMAAKNFGIIEYPAPANVTATLSDGGSLVEGTTYYYKVVLGFHHGGARGFSPRSGVVSATATSTQKTITVSWTAVPGFSQTGGYDGYIILRSTSNDFTDSERILSGTAPARYGIKTTSFEDTGALNFENQRFPDFIDGLPIIWMNGGTSGDPILMYDLYAEDVSNGWDRVFPSLDTTHIEFGVGKKAGGSYYSHASLAIGLDANENAVETHIRQRTGSIIVYGNIYMSASTNTYFGVKKNDYNHDSLYRVMIVFHGPWYFSDSWNGLHKWYGVYLVAGCYNWESSYDFYGWSNSYHTPAINGSEGSEFFECDFCQGGNSIVIKGYGTYRGCRFNDLALASANVTMIKPIMVGGYCLNCWNIGGVYSNIDIQEPTTYSASYDILWYTGTTRTFINGSWRSHDQVDNRPWFHLGYSGSGMPLGGKFTFKYNLAIQVQDENGNIISGASVSVVDSEGTTVCSGATDENGQYTPDPITSYELVPLVSETGYAKPSKSEAAWVTEGTLRRDLYTPHTVTISKAGYGTRTIQYTMDRKREEVEELVADGQEGGTVIYDSTIYDSTIY